MLRPIPILLAALITTPSAYAQQTGNPAGMSPDTPGKETASPAPDHSNPQDKLFVRQAAIGNRAEVELGKLAQTKATSQPVRDFAKRMADDHGKSGEQLLKLGRPVNADIPKDLDPEHKTLRSELDKASGKDFDVAYMSSQIADHQRTANLLLWHISNGQNEPLKKYAMDTLPVVMDHLEAAKQTFATLTSTPPGR